MSRALGCLVFSAPIVFGALALYSGSPIAETLACLSLLTIAGLFYDRGRRRPPPS